MISACSDLLDRCPLRRIVLVAVLHVSILPGSRAEDRIILGEGQANAGTTGVLVQVFITNDQPIHAFSLSISFDHDSLTLREISSEGTAVAEAGAEFFSPTIDNSTGTAVLGVIFPYNDKEPFTEIYLDSSPGTEQLVAVLNFDISGDASPGVYPIELIDRLGSPPISNVFSAGGTTIRPELESGAVIVNNENLLKLEPAIAVPGTTTRVVASGKHPEELQGYSIAFTYDKSILTAGEVTYEGTDAQRLIRPEEIEFFLPKHEPDFSLERGRISVGAVLDYVGPPTSQWTGHVIPPSPDQYQSLAIFLLQVEDDPGLVGGETELILHNGEAGSINNVFIVDKRSQSPLLENGWITFVSSPLFMRGDLNNDGRVDLSDAIFSLAYQFLGGPAPTCLSAANVNGDRGYDLSDVVYLLSYLYSGGKAPPPPNGVCGPDPSSGFDCQDAPMCQ